MKHVTLTEARPAEVADFSGSEARQPKEPDHAHLDLSFVVRNGRTVLDSRLFRYPYVLMRTFSEPSSPVQDDTATRSAPLTLIVQNSGGPIHDRDDLSTRLLLGEGTSVRILYQGATAIHRARPGEMSRERLSITLEPDSHLAYLPAPRILFPDAAHHQTSDIEISPSSSLLFTDAFTLHDPDGTARPFRELDNTLTIRRAGEIVLLDRQHLRNPLNFQTYRAFASALLLGVPNPGLSEVPDLYAATSQLPSDLGWIHRLAAPDLRPIRTAMTCVTRTGPSSR